MEGRAILTLLNYDEEYVITQPNMYARFVSTNEVLPLILSEGYYLER